MLAYREIFSRIRGMSLLDPIRQLISELEAAAQSAGFTVETYGHVCSWPLIVLTRNAPVENGTYVYLSAGIHGDEPAGPQALLELLQTGALTLDRDYTIFPVLNPSGLALGTREDSGGIDLNRDYRDLKSEETRLHAEWMTKHLTELDVCIHLHEDWESEGFYFYEINFTGKPGHASQIRSASQAHIPTELASEIDGRAAVDGLIRPHSLPELEEGDPESIFLQKNFGGLNYTLETPTKMPLEKRVAALKASVRAVLE